MRLTSTDQITHQHHLYLQRHFDDAALFCGGETAQHAGAGRNVLVISVFGGPRRIGTRLSRF